jgi:hypothetical protein
MKFHRLSLADAGKSAPSPRTRWCSYRKRNEHYLCSGFRRVNHGLIVRLSALTVNGRNQIRRLVLNRPPRTTPACSPDLFSKGEPLYARNHRL